MNQIKEYQFLGFYSPCQPNGFYGSVFLERKKKQNSNTSWEKITTVKWKIIAHSSKTQHNWTSRVPNHSFFPSFSSVLSELFFLSFSFVTPFFSPFILTQYKDMPNIHQEFPLQTSAHRGSLRPVSFIPPQPTAAAHPRPRPQPTASY